MRNQIKTTNMATLKQLIDNGLQVGALVECLAIYDYYGDEVGHSEMHVYQYHGNNFKLVFCDLQPVKNGETVDTSFHYNGFYLTTAHDSGIDPQTLPIEEPFWTGWVIHDGGKGEILEFVEGEYWPPEDFSEEGYQEPNYFKFKDGLGCFEYECRPCLPPNQ